MKQRTLILRLWRDRADALIVQLKDPVSEAHARFAAADELWKALEQWAKVSAPLPPPQEHTLTANQDELAT